MRVPDSLYEHDLIADADRHRTRRRWRVVVVERCCAVSRTHQTGYFSPDRVRRRRARPGRAQEQALAVRQHEVASVGAVRAVLRAETLDADLGPGLERVLGESAADQRIGRAAFDHPLRHRAVGVLDVEMDPRVRVDPFHLGDDALERHRLGRRRTPRQTSDAPWRTRAGRPGPRAGRR